MTRSGTWWMLAGALWLCGCGANVPTGPGTLPATTILSGRIREPGGGVPIARAQVTDANTVVGLAESSTYTDQNGFYRLTVHPDRRGSLPQVWLILAKVGYEYSRTTFFSTTDPDTHDFALQRIITIQAGDTFEGTLFPDDSSYALVEEDQCWPCKLIRVMVPPAGGVDQAHLLELRLNAQSSGSPRLLVVDGYSYLEGTTLELPARETRVMVKYPDGLGRQDFTPQPFELVTFIRSQ